jgi:hypothetical protein
MRSSLLRTANAFLAVVVAILVSRRFGDSSIARDLTVLITSAVVLLFEWLLIWTPKHSASVRRFLDERARFSGVWLQEVKKVYGSKGVERDYPNRFGIVSIDYDKDVDNYNVNGTAYTDSGDEHARWDSEPVVHFSKNGRSMTYQWKGAITSESQSMEADDPRRDGFTTLILSSDNGGRGRVDHVAVNVIIEFNLTRITAEWLAENKLSGKPETLSNPSHRDKFAKAFAETLVRQKAAGA